MRIQISDEKGSDPTVCDSALFCYDRGQGGVFLSKKRISIKYRFLLAVILILVPLTLVFSIFTTKAVSHLNRQLAEANRNTLLSFCTAITDEIQLAESTMNLLWGESEAFARISQASETERPEPALAELEIVFEDRMESNQTISSLAIYSPAFGMACETYAGRSQYSDSEKKAMEGLMLRLLEDQGEKRLGWFMEHAGEDWFFVRIVQKGTTSAVCLIDIQDISRRSQANYAMASPVVFVQKGKPLTPAMWLKKTWVDKIPEVKDFRFAGKEQQYMVVKETLMGLDVLYGVPYRNNMGTLGWLRLGPWLFSGVSTLVLLAAWIYLKYSFFRPLSDLVKTMERIRANDLESRPGRYSSKEFAQVNETFNQMIDTITNLKIENYEQRISAQNDRLLAQQSEMNAQKAELAALRMQIHPHFYLNCLKNIYGMAQAGSFQDIQGMILLLSSHLRYTFTISSDLVPLSRELQMCENYIQLQAVGQEEKPQCLLNIDPDLLDFKVPPISLLTLVENCVKHGTVQDRALSVKITAVKKAIENGFLVDIIIQDNGAGFAGEIMDELNRSGDGEFNEVHVGLFNVIRRFRLLYGENFAVSCWNKEGAAIELLFYLA